MRRLLITGFEPFGGIPHNPAEAVAARVRAPVGSSLRRLILPVDTQIAPTYLSAVIDELKPEVVVLLGLAAKRSELCIELIAKNILDFRVPDEAGHQPKRLEIIKGAPSELRTRIDATAAVSLWLGKGLPARLSEDAGEFLCNQVYYKALSVLPESARCVFVHLPPSERLNTWAATSSKPLGKPLEQARQIEAIELLLEQLVAEF